MAKNLTATAYVPTSASPREHRTIENGREALASEHQPHQRGRRVARELAIEDAGNSEMAIEHQPERDESRDQRLHQVERDELPRLERDAEHVVDEQGQQRERQRQRADEKVFAIGAGADERRRERPGEERQQRRDGERDGEPEPQRGADHAPARLAVGLLVEEPNERPIHAEHEHEHHELRIREHEIGDAVDVPGQHAGENRNQQELHRPAAHLAEAVDQGLAGEPLQGLTHAARPGRPRRGLPGSRRWDRGRDPPAFARAPCARVLARRRRGPPHRAPGSERDRRAAR